MQLTFRGKDHKKIYDSIHFCFKEGSALPYPYLDENFLPPEFQIERKLIRHRHQEVFEEIFRQKFRRIFRVPISTRLNVAETFFFAKPIRVPNFEDRLELEPERLHLQPQDEIRVEGVLLKSRIFFAISQSALFLPCFSPQMAWLGLFRSFFCKFFSHHLLLRQQESNSRLQNCTFSRDLNSGRSTD